MFESEFVKDIKPSDDFYITINRSEKDTDYQLDHELFYGLTPPFKIKSSNNQLNVNVKENKIKTLYLTYLTLDTKFAEVPGTSFVDLSKSREFYVNLDIDTNNNVEVIPYIIQYDSQGKKNMTQINRPMQYFSADDDVIKIRLVFKVKGQGNFIIRSIKRRDVRL